MVISTSYGRTVRNQQRQSPSGFSLVELMVVIAVVAIMASLLLPALNRTKEQARATACRSNMKQLSLAFLMYAEDNDDTLPWPGGVGRAISSPEAYAPDWCATPPEMPLIPFTAASADVPGFGHNAEVGSIFPYVTSQPRRAYDSTFKETTSVYRCPSAGALGEALRVNYSANARTEPGSGGSGGPPVTASSAVTPVPATGVNTAAITDPSRKVMLVNEDARGMKSTSFEPRSPAREVQYHLEKANVGFMDGHMESIPKREFMNMRVRDTDFYFTPSK